MPTIEQWAAIGLVAATLTTGILTWLATRRRDVEELERVEAILMRATSATYPERPLVRGRALMLLRDRLFQSRQPHRVVPLLVWGSLAVTILGLGAQQNAPPLQNPSSSVDADAQRKIIYLFLAANPLILALAAYRDLIRYDTSQISKVRETLADSAEHELQRSSMPPPKRLEPSVRFSNGQSSASRPGA